MPLSLAVTVGSKIRVGDCLLEVLDIHDAKTTRLKAGNKIFTITDLKRQEVLPSVFVMVSLGWSEGKKQGKNFSHLAIEAPRNCGSSESRHELVIDASLALSPTKPSWPLPPLGGCGDKAVLTHPRTGSVRICSSASDP